MELECIVNQDLPSPKQRPAWHRGKKMFTSLCNEICGELSGHELDGVIDEILTNNELKWTGEH
jgi:hypothetical protein